LRITRKSNALKLGPTLAQYLYDRKKLTLPGIGSFSFDSSFRTEADQKSASQGISFQSNPAFAWDDDLVDYVSAQTGKQKSLASADLESYLELAKQFLNIGKPFHIEGIGTLVKTQTGSFDFTSDHSLSDKVKEGTKELSATSISDQSLTTYESLKPQKETNAPYRRIFLTILVVATAGIILYGGYRIYKNNNSPADNQEEAVPQAREPVARDSATTITKPNIDSSNNNQPTTNQTASTGTHDYRFVIEEAGRNRAMYRYTMLKKDLPVHIATTDSVLFKIFFVIPATALDTARIADSLSARYPALNHKRTYAER
jgi:hypothetical protein